MRDNNYKMHAIVSTRMHAQVRPQKAGRPNFRESLAMDDNTSGQVDRSAIAAKGGIARARSLPKARQSEIGRAAAMARWSTDIPKALAEGPLHIAGRVIACAVL